MRIENVLILYSFSFFKTDDFSSHKIDVMALVLSYFFKKLTTFKKNATFVHVH